MKNTTNNTPSKIDEYFKTAQLIACSIVLAIALAGIIYELIKAI